MRKRGQLTLFVIIAVVFVVGILIYSLVDFSSFSEESYSPGVSTYRDSLLNCFSYFYEEELFALGVQGGYYNSDVPYLYTPQYDVSYYYVNGSTYVPQIDTILTSYEALLEQTTHFCFENVSSSLSPSVSEIDFEVFLQNNELMIVPAMKLEFAENGSSVVVDLSRYSTVIPVRISDYQKASQEVVGIISYDDGGYIPVSQLSEIGEQYDFYVNVIPSSYDEFAYYYVFTSKSNSTQPPFWQFLVKHEFEDVQFPYVS